MERVELRTIEDLEKLGRPYVRKLLREWDFAGEMQEWAKTVAAKGMQFTSTYVWNKDRNQARFHPSSLKHSCDMYLFLQLIGEQESRKKQSQQAIFDTGTVIHLMMNYYMHTLAIDKGFIYNDEVALWKTSQVADTYQLCGSTDGVFERELDIGRVRLVLRALIDWKSINSSGFSALRESVGTDYEKQMHTYMVTGDIPVTFVFYVNKDNSVFKSIPVLFDPKTWSPLGKRLLDIIAISEEMREPQKTVGKHCYSCPYLDKCEPPITSEKRRKREPRL